MSTLRPQIRADNKEPKAMPAQATALPRDYQIVYEAMKSHLCQCSAGDGMDIVAILNALLALFEASAAASQHVPPATAEEVATFCDQRLRATTSYLHTWQASLNREVTTTLTTSPSTDGS